LGAKYKFTKATSDKSYWHKESTLPMTRAFNNVWYSTFWSDLIDYGKIYHSKPIFWFYRRFSLYLIRDFIKRLEIYRN